MMVYLLIIKFILHFAITSVKFIGEITDLRTLRVEFQILKAEVIILE